MKCGAPSNSNEFAVDSRVAGTDHDIMSDENPGLRVQFSSDVHETFDDLFVGGHAEVSPVPLPLPNALLHLPICLGSLFFPSRTPLTDKVSPSISLLRGGARVPHVGALKAALQVERVSDVSGVAGVPSEAFRSRTLFKEPPNAINARH